MEQSVLPLFNFRVNDMRCRAARLPTIEKMKRFYLFPLTLCLMLATLAACGGKEPVKRTEADAARKAAPDPTNTTRYVTLNAVKGDSIVVSEGDATLTLGYKTALSDGTTAGSLEAGHDYAITVNTDSRTLLTSLDLTALQGVWLLADGSGSGLRIGPDGEASTIGTLGTMTLRSWSISNGRLQFAYVANDGTNYDEQQDVAHIMALTPTRLQFSFGGMQYELQRP